MVGDSHTAMPLQTGSAQNILPFSSISILCILSNPAYDLSTLAYRHPSLFKTLPKWFLEFILIYIQVMT